MTHPNVEEVAEHLEGVLDPDSDRRVREHLRDCADCAGVARDLAGVPDRLRTAAAAVPPMPADLAHRVESAIAAESRRPHADRDVLPRHAGVSAAERPTQRVWRRRAAVGLLAAAAVTVVAVSVGDVLPGGVSGSSQRESATAGRAAPESQAGPESQAAPEAQGDQRGSADRGEGAQLGPQALQDGAGGDARLRSLTGAALIDAVAAAHTPGSTSRDRAGCVAAALRDSARAGAARAGSSYAVTLPGRPDGVPGAVWLGPRSAPTQGVLVTCEPRPRVLLRRGLRD